jgi:large subunit ribosomal protein L4e
MATQRPTVSVHGEGATKKVVKLPHVFGCALRPDLVQSVHTNMAKNRRQAQGLKDHTAIGHSQTGYDTAAASWGTGRAVARIPRVPGGGTHRSGQGAFGNMCRGGGMYNPLKTWRRWHRKTGKTMKRHAVASAIAASAVPALVMARGHKIDDIPELPLVLSAESEKIEKTKDAIKLLKELGCGAELKKVIDSKKVRRGVGKMRNRRYVMRKGPLVVYAKDDGMCKAFRNIPGVELCSVERLNLLQLAPGGQFGRFTIYTEGAIKKLGPLFGTFKAGSSQVKKGYTLPRALMTNCDIARIINSEEVQAVLAPQKETARGFRQRKNPLKNKSVLARLCPYALKAVKVHKKKLAGVQKAGKKAAAKPKTGKVFFDALEEPYKVVPAPAEEEAEEEEE